MLGNEKDIMLKVVKLPNKGEKKCEMEEYWPENKQHDIPEKVISPYAKGTKTDGFVKSGLQ